MSLRLLLLGFSLSLLLAPPAATAGRARTLSAGEGERRAAVERSLAWLRSQQRADGSIGGLGVSCEVAWVVALAGANPGGPTWTGEEGSLLAACERETPAYLASGDAGRLGKVLRAVAAAGANAHDFAGQDLIAAAQAHFDPHTQLFDRNFFFRQTLIILALHEAGQPLPPGLLPAILSQQHADGGWSWAIEPDPAAGFSSDSDLDATARALQVLRALGLPSGHAAVSAAVVYVTSLQNPDGGWGLHGGPTNSNSTALAIDALVAAGWNPQAPRFGRSGRSPVQVLLDLQESSGAFRYREAQEESRLLATLDAIPALLQPYPQGLSAPLPYYLPILLHA